MTQTRHESRPLTCPSASAPSLNSNNEASTQTITRLADAWGGGVVWPVGGEGGEGGVGVAGEPAQAGADGVAAGFGGDRVRPHPRQPTGSIWLTPPVGLPDASASLQSVLYVPGNRVGQLGVVWAPSYARGMPGPRTGANRFPAVEQFESNESSIRGFGGVMKRVLSAILLMTAGVVGVATPAWATTVNLAVTGSVQCTQGKPVVGIWVNSSAGGSGWAGWLKGHDATVRYFRYPSAHGTISTAAGTNISVHVGCGMTGTKWASDNWTANYVAASSGHLVLNAYSCQPPKWVGGQTVRGSCSLPPKGTPGSATINPFGTVKSGAKGYCTCGASYLWFRNTGRYPAWVGNAIDWKANAQAKGWKVFSYPAEHALIVWPRTSNFAGRNHVGYVTSINVNTAMLTFTDMNGGRHVGAQWKTELFGQYDSKSCSLSTSKCTSVRLGVVMNELAGAQFIAANPGYDWSWGSGSYPATSAECKP